MKTNALGLALLKSLEGCRYKAYKLSNEKYYTIGYGHSYDNTITADTVWTQAQCDSALVTDLAKYENYVTTIAVKKFPALNENQFSALVSYTYNRGAGGLKQLVNASGTITELGNNIVVYWGSNSTYKNALISRRKKEMALFNKGSVVKVDTTYYKKYTGKSNSFAAALTEYGYDGSYKHRGQIAVYNGLISNITKWSGQADLNLKMFTLYRQGKLKHE